MRRLWRASPSGSAGLGGLSRSIDRMFHDCMDTGRPGYPRPMSTGDDELFGQEHVEAYRETDGERGYHWRGTEILLLTTFGRNSGDQRTTPLIHRTDGDRFVVIASKGGSPDHPDWFK